MPKKYQSLIKKIEEMSVKELAKLVKELEEKFGPVVAAAAPAAAQAGAGAETVAKSEYNLELQDAGSNKIAVIKVVKEITGKGLIEAKQITEALPAILKEKVKKEEAEELKKKLEQAGAKVELK
ncbi:MAG: 50S ribosomal protein L7/L12 [bacterium]